MDNQTLLNLLLSLQGILLIVVGFFIRAKLSQVDRQESRLQEIAAVTGKLIDSVESHEKLDVERFDNVSRLIDLRANALQDTLKDMKDRQAEIRDSITRIENRLLG